MDETIHDRIGALVQEYGDGKNTVFANKIGISEGNIRGYIKGIMPKADVLEKIVRTLDVNAMWLLTGIGHMRVSNLDINAPVLVSDNDRLAPILQQFDVFIQKKDAQIVQQAEEIREKMPRMSRLLALQMSDNSDKYLAPLICPFICPIYGYFLRNHAVFSFFRGENTP